jgi:hypothetical protein
MLETEILDAAIPSPLPGLDDLGTPLTRFLLSEVIVDPLGSALFSCD